MLRVGYPLKEVRYAPTLVAEPAARTCLPSGSDNDESDTTQNSFKNRIYSEDLSPCFSTVGRSDSGSRRAKSEFVDLVEVPVVHKTLQVSSLPPVPYSIRLLPKLE